MSTAVDGAADDDDEPFSGNWRDQFTNEYTVTGCKGTYSVTINHKQDGAECGTTETLAGIIKRDANGGYTWGITHKLHIRDDGNLVWNALKEGKKPWEWTQRRCPRSFSPSETSLQVSMTDLQRRLKKCLESPLSTNMTECASHSVCAFVSPPYGKI